MFFNDQSVEFMSSLWSRGEAGVHAGLSSRRSRVRVPSGPRVQMFTSVTVE